MDDLAAHIDAIGHPNIRAMYDTFHSNIEEADPVGAFTHNADRIVHVHISENDRGCRAVATFHAGDTSRKSVRAAMTLADNRAFRRALKDLAAATKVGAISPRPPKRSTGWIPSHSGTDGSSGLTDPAFQTTS